jgi:hypothetical protein
VRGNQRGEGRGGRGGGAHAGVGGEEWAHDGVGGEEGARAVGERRGRRAARAGGRRGGGGLGFGGRPYICERGKGRWWAVGPILALGSIMGWLCRE